MTRSREGGARSYRGIRWLTAALLTALVALVVGPIAALPDVSLAGTHLPWWVLAGAFFVVELEDFDVEIRHEAHAVSFSEVPLVVGLFFASPEGLVAAQVVGFLAAAVWERRSAVKTAFNVGAIGSVTALAVVLVRGVEPAVADGLSPSEWLAVIAAVAVADVLGWLLVGIPIALYDRPGWRESANTFLVGVVLSLFSATFGLATVAMALVDPSSALLLAPAALVLYLSFRALDRDRRNRATIAALGDIAGELQVAGDLEEAVERILVHAREVLRGEAARLELDDPDGGAVVRVVGSPAGGADWRWSPGDRSARVLSRGADELAGTGLREAVVVPLTVQGEVIGSLAVVNRLGDRGGFVAADLARLETVANHTAAALRGAQLVTQLEASLAELRRLNRVKDDFLSMASHELRTPLTPVLGLLDVLDKRWTEMPDEQRRSLLTVVRRNARRLLWLVTDLLSMSQREAGALVADPIPVPLDAAVRAALEVFSDSSDVRIGRLDGVVVLCDATHLEHALINLLSNARKYGRPPITVDAHQADGHVTVSVSDRGDGVPDEFLPQLFEPFTQASTGDRRTAQGVGLGLSVVRALVAANGGEVRYRRDPGGGACFELTVPAARLAPPLAAS